MRHVTTTALAALLVGMFGAVALAPAANAEDATSPAAPAIAAPADPSADTDMAAAGDAGGDMGQVRGPGMMGHGDMPFGPRGGMMGGRLGLLEFACGDRGAEALEIAFVHINYSVKPTTAQAPLLDALKTTALADQKKLADTCQTALKDDAGKPTILDRLQTRLTLDNARVAALSDVLPKFKAFYDSLTDDQKAKLEPHRGAWAKFGFNGGAARDGQNWHRFGPGRNGPMHPPVQPGAVQPSSDGPAPDAPALPGSDT